MQLSAIIHSTADRSYEDLRLLQAECVSASDVERKRKLIDFCEIQRHRAIQLLALVKYAENEAEIVRTAVEGMGQTALTKLGKYHNTHWALGNSSQKFEFARAPKYDIVTSVNTLVNGIFQGFPSLVDNVFDNGEAEEDDPAYQNRSERVPPEKRIRLMRDRVLSRLLIHDVDAAYQQSKELSLANDECEVAIDCEHNEGGYTVKLALEEGFSTGDENEMKSAVWYPTWIRILVKNGEAQGRENDSQFVPHKHIPILGKQLEGYLNNQRESETSVITMVHTFMRTFCAAFAFQILESQAKAGNLTFERTPELCKIGLNIQDWHLIVKRRSLIDVVDTEVDEKMKKSGSSLPPTLGFFLSHGSDEFPFEHEVDGSRLHDLSLKRLVAASIREAAKHQLEHVRTAVLNQTVRHHHSQARIRFVSAQEAAAEYGGYRLEFRLFDDDSYLTLYMNAQGALQLETNSKATRWGYHSVEDVLSMTQLTLLKSPATSWGPIIADIWNRAEAWDCLACVNIPGLTKQRPALLPPDAEIAKRHQPPGPSAYWSIGSFEGFRYFFATKFLPPASSFHSSFLPLRQRLEEATYCEIISVPSSPDENVGESNRDMKGTHSSDINPIPGYRAERVYLKELNTIEDVFAKVRAMRRAWAEQRLGRFGLFYSMDDGLFRGGDTSEVQALAPYMLLFSEEGEEAQVSCKIACAAPHNVDMFLCKRNEAVDATFEEMIRRRSILQRLAACANNNVEIQAVFGEKRFCVIRWPGRSDEEVTMVGFKSDKSLSVVCGKPHPLEQIIAKEWNRDSSIESFTEGLNLLRESNMIIKEAEAYAHRSGRTLRVCATSIANLHFYFDGGNNQARKTFDCRITGYGEASLWGRLGWDSQSPIQGVDLKNTVEAVIEALRRA